MGNIHSTFPIVFSHKGRVEQHSQEYRDFKKRWSFISTLYDAAEEKIEKVEKINRTYLNDFLQYMSYMIDKGEMERAEEKFKDALRKMKKNR